MTWHLEYWSRGRWNDDGVYKFTTEGEANAFIQRIVVGYRRSGLPGFSYRAVCR